MATTTLDVGIVVAACIVWAKNAQIAQVQKVLAISTVAAHTAEYKHGTGRLPYALQRSRANAIVSQAQPTSDTAFQATLTLDKLLQHNAFLESKDDWVLLKAQQLLNVAMKAYQAMPNVNSKEAICSALLPGSSTVLPGCEMLAAQTVNMLLSNDDVTIQQLLSEAATAITTFGQPGAPPIPLARPLPMADSVGTETGASSETVEEWPVLGNPTQQQPVSAIFKGVLPQKLPPETEEVEHWPALPAAAPTAKPAQIAPQKPLAALLKPVTAVQPAIRRSLDAGNAEPTQQLQKQPSQHSNGDQTACQPSTTAAGFRKAVGVGLGDDSILWERLLEMVGKSLSEFSTDPEHQKELLSLALVLTTVFPANNGAQINRFVIGIAIISSPIEIVGLNKGRHRCVKKFVEKLTYWCHKRLLEVGVGKGDLLSEEYLFKSDPFFFTKDDFVVLRLRQLAAAMLKIAESPPAAHPNISFPPTLAALDITMQHNQSKPVYEAMTKLLQPPTKAAYCTAVLDWCKRFTANVSAEETAKTLDNVIAANKRSTAQRWPPALLQIQANTQLQKARMEQAAAVKASDMDALLKQYNASKPLPLTHYATTGYDECYHDTPLHNAAAAAKAVPAIPGAEFIDSPQKKAKRPPAAAAKAPVKPKPAARPPEAGPAQPHQQQPGVSSIKQQLPAAARQIPAERAKEIAAKSKALSRMDLTQRHKELLPMAGLGDDSDASTEDNVILPPANNIHQQAPVADVGVQPDQETRNETAKTQEPAVIPPIFSKYRHQVFDLQTVTIGPTVPAVAPQAAPSSKDYKAFGSSAVSDVYSTSPAPASQAATLSRLFGGLQAPSAAAQRPPRPPGLFDNGFGLGESPAGFGLSQQGTFRTISPAQSDTISQPSSYQAPSIFGARPTQMDYPDYGFGQTSLFGQPMGFGSTFLPPRTTNAGERLFNGPSVFDPSGWQPARPQDNGFSAVQQAFASQALASSVQPTSTHPIAPVRPVVLQPQQPTLSTNYVSNIDTGNNGPVVPNIVLPTIAAPMFPDSLTPTIQSQVQSAGTSQQAITNSNVVDELLDLLMD